MESHSSQEFSMMYVLFDDLMSPTYKTDKEYNISAVKLYVIINYLNKIQTISNVYFLLKVHIQQ